MSKILEYMRYRSWKVIIQVLLLTIGLVNIFPFIWMIGTSLKSTSEASVQRNNIMPQQKYFLAKNIMWEKVGKLNTRKMSLIKSLHTEDQKRRKADRPTRTGRGLRQ